MKKLYNEERDTDKYDNIVMNHMMAMTAEELYSKAAIAVELAYRDWQIEQLREALQALYDEQNGPPLIRDAARWEAAMQLSSKALEQTK